MDVHGLRAAFRKSAFFSSLVTHIMRIITPGKWFVVLATQSFKSECLLLSVENNVGAYCTVHDIANDRKKNKKNMHPPLLGH